MRDFKLEVVQHIYPISRTFFYEQQKPENLYESNCGFSFGTKAEPTTLLGLADQQTPVRARLTLAWGFGYFGKAKKLIRAKGKGFASKAIR